mmetsp:Transcript_59451/g.166044  ORF Transcript_59451/g.166044 Transcript_59451/m.166044 type:complete len:136 (+) Transcript_59451:56-463(+)
MRNRGPGQWREWRWGSQVVPLMAVDPKAPVPEGTKSLNEVAYLTMYALAGKGALPTLTAQINELIADPDVKEDGRVSEERLREAFKKAASTCLPPEELETIWPTPVVEAPPIEGSRRGTKSASGRKSTKQPTDAP